MQPLSYVNWAKNEPNDAYGAEKCVEIVSNGNCFTYTSSTQITLIWRISCFGQMSPLQRIALYVRGVYLGVRTKL